jgi:hypothetical protein
MSGSGEVRHFIEAASAVDFRSERVVWSRLIFCVTLIGPQASLNQVC